MPRPPDPNIPDTDILGRAASRPYLDTVPPVASRIAIWLETPAGCGRGDSPLGLDDHIQRGPQSTGGVYHSSIGVVGLRAISGDYHPGVPAAWLEYARQ
jgi:hypothetical protein